MLLRLKFQHDADLVDLSFKVRMDVRIFTAACVCSPLVKTLSLAISFLRAQQMKGQSNSVLSDVYSCLCVVIFHYWEQSRQNAYGECFRWHFIPARLGGYSGMSG